MKFQFDVWLREADFLDFNVFAATESPTGKAQMTRLRILAVIFSLVAAGVFLLAEKTHGAIFMVVFAVAMVFLVKPIVISSVKSTLKTMKKKGKLPYTPESVLEFYDDHFVEITPEARNEMNYSIVERVDVLSDKAIYIYVNSIMAYIVPRSCFYRDEEVASFIEYLRAKCKNIYFY